MKKLNRVLTIITGSNFQLNILIVVLSLVHLFILRYALMRIEIRHFQTIHIKCCIHSTQNNFLFNQNTNI